jgi:DNA polymerase-3 subunit delta
VRVSAQQAAGALRAPDPGVVGYLLYGADAAEVDAARAELARRLIAAGGEGSELTWTDGPAARRDPEGLAAALRAGGLFGGRPVVAMTSAGDGATEAVAQALDGLAPGGGVLIALAGILPARSKLRKLFEEGRALLAAPIEARAPSSAEIRELLAEQGLRAVAEDGMEALVAAAGMLDPAEMRGLLSLLALYMLGREAPAGAADVEACMPGLVQGDAEEVVEAVTVRRPAAAAARLRPPVFGARRDRLVQAARDWPPAALEAGLAAVLDAELRLRSSGLGPDAAEVQRLAVRLASLK